MFVNTTCNTISRPVIIFITNKVKRIQNKLSWFSIKYILLRVIITVIQNVKTNIKYVKKKGHTFFFFGMARKWRQSARGRDAKWRVLAVGRLSDTDCRANYNRQRQWRQPALDRSLVGGARRFIVVFTFHSWEKLAKITTIFSWGSCARPVFVH